MRGLAASLYLSLFFLTACSGFESIDPAQKSHLLKTSGVFSDKVLKVSMSDDLRGQFPIVEVQDDEGSQDNQNTDDGMTFVFQDDDGEINVVDTDTGTDLGIGEDDDGEMDGNDPDGGTPMPTPFGVRGIAQNLDISRAKQCVLTEGRTGVQYLTDDNLTYSACSPCAVFDPQLQECVKINVTAETDENNPQPTQRRRRRNRWLRVGAILLGTLAVGAVINSVGRPNVTGGPKPPPRGASSVPGAPRVSIPGPGGPEPPFGDPNDPNCPLIIDVSASGKFNFQNLELSAPEDGVAFAIRGKKNNYQKLKISWTKNPRYMFLVKPNQNGEILSIDELFGNHTKGPNNEYAAHGFEALAKYDGKDLRGLPMGIREGLITESDPIYSALRLWSDSNFDGLAQKTELKTLKEMGIVTIDLKYDSHFYERDQYGNEAIFKSVVKFDNDKLGIMFDLWFK